MKKRYVLLLIVLAATTSFLCAQRLYYHRSYDSTEEFSRLIYFPSSLLNIITLEFPGIVGDYLLLKFLVLHGERLMDKKSFTAEEWEISYKTLQQISELDPRFWDTYVLAEMTFPWDAAMVEETNELLKKAIQYRPEDYRPYYYIWFNYYHFLKDAGKAAPFLEKDHKSLVLLNF